MIRIIRHDNGGTRHMTRSNELCAIALCNLVNTVGVNHVVVHYDDDSMTVYQREAQAPDAPTLDLTPDELLREHGVWTVPVDPDDPDVAISRFRGALDEFRALQEAQAVGQERPQTPILDGYMAQRRADEREQR